MKYEKKCNIFYTNDLSNNFIKYVVIFLSANQLFLEYPLYSMLFLRKYSHVASYVATDYGFPVRKLLSLHGRKSTPTPKFLGTAEAYFVCHIGPNFQISLIYTFIGCPTSVVRVNMLPSACKRQIQKKSP